MGYIDGIHVTIYSSTMDPSWDRYQHFFSTSRCFYNFGILEDVAGCGTKSGFTVRDPMDWFVVSPG